MSDNIDDILAEFEEENKEVVKVSSNLPTEISFRGNLVDTTDDDELTAMILLSALEDKEKADDLYDIFKLNVEMSKDRSDSSKEALTSAVETRVNATTNLVKILDIRSKRKQQMSGNNFLNLQISSKEAGIDLKNIKDNLEGFE
jgi:predicted nucleotidyltransferase component of viral defense system